MQERGKRGSKPAPPRFDADDLARLRVMKELGIHTRAEWDAMSDEDRIDWLAQDHLHQIQVKGVLKALNERIENDEMNEQAAYIAVLLETMK